MVEYILMGTQKNGCSIDNRNKEIIYYQLLSFYEKIVKKPQQLLIKYSDIKKIKICYGLTTGVRFDSAQITMEVLTQHNTIYDIPMTYNSTQRKDVLLFIEILKSSNLLIEDPYNILSLYPETKLDLIDFIKLINKEHYKKS
ncbi:hypothetical protein B5E48_05220 [Massilimicrobiota sp. An105]|jgi:hypothetical protein|uniref:hypothetical protein n=1 Tax=Massilimicrobiota sp. An105 TaxID=1965540 RepID=UPI000B382FE3|nr:hypothetical protein [Massilimicrobiota sp. An105]OUQ80292.1 hypothetical protein B5E48_05220 [Massilimicrobiota sp. An105]